MRKLIILFEYLKLSELLSTYYHKLIDRYAPSYMSHICISRLLTSKIPCKLKKQKRKENRNSKLHY